MGVVPQIPKSRNRERQVCCVEFRSRSCGLFQHRSPVLNISFQSAFLHGFQKSAAACYLLTKLSVVKLANL